MTSRLIGTWHLVSWEFRLFPNWVGTVQERLLKFEDGDLVLFTEAFVENGEEQVAYAIWRKRT